MEAKHYTLITDLYTELLTASARLTLKARSVSIYDSIKISLAQR